MNSARERSPTLSPDDPVAAVRRLLGRIADPEIPVLTIADLGVLQDVSYHDGELQVIITPTYSACPAIKTIEQDILATLGERGYEHVQVKTRLSPAWSTDWLSDAGREKLLRYGIAPPVGAASQCPLHTPHIKVQCPQCQSSNTRIISAFGSTPCKALYQCHDCLEPFDYFKCI